MDIRFRAYNKNAKDFIRDDQGQISIFDLIAWARYATVNKLKNINHLIVQQSTGLLAKNEKEICDGDIIKHTDGVSKVEWDNLGWTARTKGGNNAFIWDWGNKIKIIGNIFENPELIK